MGTGYTAPDFNAAPHITGAPGPPCPPASCYMMREEDDEDMLIGGESDDLGDLMQQMRDGAAWTEDLVMDTEMPLCSSGPAPTYGAAPAAAPPPATAGPTSRAPAGSLDPSMQALAALTERHSLDRAAEEDAAAAGLQPALRALLMHPGGRGGGHMMIPCGGAPPGGMSCAANLAATRPSQDGCPLWPPQQPPQQQAQFYGGPPPPQMEQPGPGQFYGMPNTAAPPMRSSASPFQSMPYFQGAPVGFPPSQPLPPQQLQQQLQQQRQQSGQGTAASGRMPGMPQQQQAQQALQALQQQQCQQGMMQAMFPSGAAAGYPMQHLPQPSCGSGSGNASDGTTLRMRNSFDCDTGGSAVAPCGSCPSAPSAPAPQHAQHAQQAQHSPAPAPLGQMCSAAALAAFDQAAFDQQPSTGGERFQTWRMPNDGGGVPFGLDMGGECDAPSDSSDCDDHERSKLMGHTSRDHSAQVVPEVHCYPCPSHLAPAPGQAPSVYADFPPLPVLSSYYDTPAAHTARMARHASLERYRAKKLRRGFGKKIRYQARKVNADKRPRVKGRFVKAGEAADILAGRAAAAAAAASDELCPALSGPSGATSCFTKVTHA